MIAEEALVEVFGAPVMSKAMQFAPRVRDAVRARFPGMVHFDGTARLQSVGHFDDTWLHELLLAVGRLTGLAALINTSFNSNGKPIVNRVTSCLRMLDELADLDYVLIEDWLFQAPSKKSEVMHGDFTKEDHGQAIDLFMKSIARSVRRAVSSENV